MRLVAKLLVGVDYLRRVALWVWAILFAMASLLAAVLYGCGVASTRELPLTGRLLCYGSVVAIVLGIVAAARETEQRKAGLIAAGIGFTALASWAVVRLLTRLFAF